MQYFSGQLKAIFLDMDETLCDTTGANNQALERLAQMAAELFPEAFDSQAFAKAYLAGIYRELSEAQKADLLPITHEENFRHRLIQWILQDMDISEAQGNTLANAQALQSCFDDARTECFDFFEGIGDWLTKMREHYQLVVITNGPEFSQVTKLERVNMANFVDHIIIGGQEPAQKPAKSIFDKALKLCNLQPDEVIHVGDSLSADIQGAINAGIQNVWIQHHQDADPNIQADWVINHPFELEALIENISKK